MISVYDPDGIEALRRTHAVQPHALKRFYNALFKHSADASEACTSLPDAARKDFSEQVSYKLLELAGREDSAIDGASKLLFRTDDGHLIESVILRPATGRTTLCISTQIGCACGCVFCATGRMGLMRNLSAGEILDQIVQAGQLLKEEERIVRNVVFMGMGEPLLNTEALFHALERLRDPAWFNFSGAHLTVSTVGIPKMIQAFSARFPEVQLAVSLHSVDQEVRSRLMPVACAHPLPQLREALVKAAENGTVMIEYMMLAGVNDTPSDLEGLIDYLQGIPAHINLIPLNPYDGCSFEGTPQAERVAFAARLKEAGFTTTLRYSLGTDIAAGCGQLVQKKIALA